MRALVLGVCGAALLAGSGAPAQRVPPRGEPDWRARAAAGLAPRVKVWVEDDARTAATHPPERRGGDPYDRDDDYDRYDRYDDGETLGRQRIFFRVDEDAYVTVASIASDGQVRILYPESPWDERPAPGGLTLDLALDGGELTGGGASDGSGYVVALASYEPADYGDYAGRGGWRPGLVPPPVVLERSAAYPVGGIEELADQLYRRGVPYALDFAYYRVAPGRPYAGYPSYPSRRAHYAECAALAVRRGVPVASVWSSYESACLLGVYGYRPYGYGVYGYLPPGYGRYGYGPPGGRARARPPRVAPRQAIGARAARDARRALRPRAAPRLRDVRGSDDEARPRDDGVTRRVEGPGRDAARARRQRPGTIAPAPRVEPGRAEPRRLERREPEARRPADRSRSSARSTQRAAAAERRGRP